MKNNKLLTYVLIGAVVAVWGWVIFKIINGGGSGNSGNVIIENNSKIETSNAELDTFSLIAEYRDPFVIKYVSVNLAEDLNLEEAKPEKIKPIINWPTIKYVGTVKNKVSDKKIALVNINDRNILLGVGDTAQEVYITAIYSDSLLVLYKKEIKAIEKTKSPSTQTPTNTEKEKKKNK
jgi:hypothetical protein